jgi:hypothetical protein
MSDSGDDLVALDQFQSLSEIELVVGLLEESGIPVVQRGLYDIKVPRQILVPRSSVEAANRVIAEAQDCNAEPPLAAPPSDFSTAMWIWIIAVLALGLFILGKAIYVFVRRGA